MRGHPSVAMVRADARRAGGVHRYATWVTSEPQNGGHHTWQVMRILSTIWPEVTADAMVFALHHDSGELGSGDIPYPHKMENPQLKSIMDGLEQKSIRSMEIQVPDPGDLWKQRIKTCDLIEMLEKGMDEVLLGSTFGVPVIQQIEAQLAVRVHTPEDTPRVERYLDQRWERFRHAKAEMVRMMLDD